MTDKYIGKPVLEHCYCEHEYKNSESKKVHQKGSKSKKKGVLKAGIEPRMVICLRLRGVSVQAVYTWFWQVFSLSLHQCI